jgi:hypothetical protein
MEKNVFRLSFTQYSPHFYDDKYLLKFWLFYYILNHFDIYNIHLLILKNTILFYNQISLVNLAINFTIIVL